MTDQAEPGLGNHEPGDEGREPRGFDRKLLLSLSISFLAVAAVFTIVALRRCNAECSDWEAQLDLFDSELQRYLQTKGPRRAAALESLSRIELPCDKVAQAREVCVSAYRALDGAEAEHRTAKKLLNRIEGAIASLDPPQREVAKRKLLAGQDLETIARELELPEGEVARRLDAAQDELARVELPRLHEEFEKAVERSNRLLKIARQTNAECDSSYKLLLRQRR